MSAGKRHFLANLNVTNRLLACLLLASCLLAFGVQDPSPAAAAGSPIILTVSGKIDRVKYPNGATFDRDTLLNLGIETLETETHYTTGMQRFEGIRLSRLLEAVGARGETLTTTALDGYGVDIPMADVERYQVFLAMKWNGEVMRPRNKGPIWIIYPITQFPEVNTEIFSIRSIWQLKTLTVK